ncbi:diguanylate cyclase [Bacillota bacterium]
MSNQRSELHLFIHCLKAIKSMLSLDLWFRDTEGNYIIGGGHKEELYARGEDFLVDEDASAAGSFFSSEDYGISVGSTIGHNETTESGSYTVYETEILSGAGDLLGVFGFSKDVTQEVLLSNFPGFAYRSIDDEEYTMTFISAGCYELTGYKQEELIGKAPSYYSLIQPGYNEKLMRQWKTDLKPDEVGSEEYPITAASGETKWVWEQYHERRDPNQVYIATEGFITDITEKKLAERALAASEDRFRSMFERAPLGIAIVDTESNVALEINNKFVEIMGRPREELLNIPWLDYTHPDDIELNIKNLDYLSITSGFSMNKRYIKGDGSIIWANMTVVPFPSVTTTSKRHFCMIEDITIRKQAEEDILYLSYNDALTGLHNRRYYELMVKRLDNKAKLPLSMIVADVNGLKLVNDAFGHMAGDELLLKIADSLKETSRPDDIVARIGGDEFVLLLPNTTYAEAESIIDKICSSISGKKVNYINCSVSFGLAARETLADEINSIFIRAEDQMYRNKLSEGMRMRSETIKAITNALYEKSDQEHRHSERVADFCEMMGKALAMNASEISELKTAGLLHDIGKIGIDLRLLNKREPLSDTEWMEVKHHSEIGYRILKSVAEFTAIAEYVLHHHERIDGQGYPRGITGREIPLQSKIIGLADAYDQMTDYCFPDKKKPPEEAFDELRRHSGTQFDGDLVEIFIRELSKNCE